MKIVIDTDHIVNTAKLLGKAVNTVCWKAPRALKDANDVRKWKRELKRYERAMILKRKLRGEGS